MQSDLIPHDSGDFIVFEGIDGSGKSTVMKAVYDHFNALPIKVISTAEPSRLMYGQLFRERIKTHSDSSLILEPYIDTFLITLDRYEHYQKEILPFLQKKRSMVLCDRYLYSTLAYQTSESISWDWILKLHEYVPKPDLVFIFDLDPTIALSRIADRPNKDRFEELRRLNEIRKNYLNIDKGERLVRVDKREGIIEILPQKPKFVIIDASLPLMEVIETVIDKIELYLDDLL